MFKCEIDIFFTFFKKHLKINVDSRKFKVLINPDKIVELRHVTLTIF